jgi:signal transduction histidine kinase
MHIIKHFGLWAVSLYRSLYFPPAMIAIAILVATTVTWTSSRQSLNHDIQTAVNRRVGATEQSLRTTLHAYEEILHGGVGLHKGSQEVTRADWSEFLQAFDLKRNYASAQAIGFIKVVQPNEVASFNAYMQSQGIPSYQVHPLNPNATAYAPLTYVEAIALRTVPNFGFDSYSQPDRREAMLRARDTGDTALTKRVTIAPQGDTKTYPGFVMYAPYYTDGQPTQTVTERQSALNGYVYASFRSDLFFQSMAGASDNDVNGFKISVDDNSHPLYQSPNFSDVSKQSAVVNVTRDLQVYGQTWHVQYVFDRQGIVSDVQLRRPGSVLFGGIFTAALIATVVYLLLRARAQELAAQKEQAVELAKDELLSLASHQLRTPATGVKQYLGMVLQGFAGDVPKDQQTLLEKAYASNDRQLNIINEILHLAKIDSGRIVLARQETDLGALVQDIINEQQRDIEAANHVVLLRLPRRPIIIHVDAHTLRMAIENILSNAIKYTPNGGEITIKVYKDIRRAYVRIKDTGIGIANNDIDKLFKQFSRLPNEMSLRVGGTGIGLYLAKHLVELHGGRIIVRSAPNKGSTFTIVLPLKEDELL